MANARPTRTLNPLPFQDLEPHRFEDLVRALAYGFRNWASLEATGRSGSDEGIDILGTEITNEVSVAGSAIDDDNDDDELFVSSTPASRRWIFQCKREKSLGPKDVKKAVAESLDRVAAPYGFVLAVACDVSTKARDAFRAEMVKRGVQEFYIWSRGELEDMLLQPHHDRVLFGFFGISLQPRRQATFTTLRSSIVLKKRLKTALKNEEYDERKVILLRDPLDDRYPEPAKDARWMLCEFNDVAFPGGIRVLHTEHLAWIRVRDENWDAVREYDSGSWSRLQRACRLDGHRGWAAEQAEEYRQHAADAFWSAHVPENERAYLKIKRLVPYARIVAFDPLGDGYYPVPQILVEWDPKNGPFDDAQWAWLETPGRGGGGGVGFLPAKEKRVQLFPVPIPDQSYPPPAGFEHVVPPKPLSDDADVRLREILEAAKPPAVAAETETTNMREPRQLPDRDAFVKWRDEVAAPVLSTFVQKLRATGHEAWVSVAGTPPDQSGYQWSEEIELNVCAGFAPYVHNPTYRPTGHARFTASAHRPFEVEIQPFKEPDEGSASKPNPYAPRVAQPERPNPKLDAYDQARLERDMTIMIERLLIPQ